MPPQPTAEGKGFFHQQTLLTVSRVCWCLVGHLTLLPPLPQHLGWQGASSFYRGEAETEREQRTDPAGSPRLLPVPHVAGGW